MTFPDIAFIVTLVVAAVLEVRASGKDVYAWLFILLSVALLWHLLPGQ